MEKLPVLSNILLVSLTVCLCHSVHLFVFVSCYLLLLLLCLPSQPCASSSSSEVSDFEHLHCDSSRDPPSLAAAAAASLHTIDKVNHSSTVCHWLLHTEKITCIPTRILHRTQHHNWLNQVVSVPVFPHMTKKNSDERKERAPCHK